MALSFDQTRQQEGTASLSPFVLAVLASLAALGSLATNIILPALPDIGRSLGITTRELAVTLSSFFLAFAFGQLFVGPLSDRIGRKWLVSGGLVVFAAGSALCATAGTLEWLVLGRVVQALGACAASVLSRAIARDLFDGAVLARAMAFIMVAMAAAPGFSPLLGGFLGSVAGWRGVFWLVGMLALVLGGLYFRGLGETHAPDVRRHSTVASVLEDYLGLLQDRRFIAPALGVGMAIGALFTFFATAPAILMDGLGLTSLGLGWFFSATVFVVFGAGLAAPRLALRWGTRAIAMTGVVVALCGGVLLLGGTAGLAHFSVSLTIFLFGIGLVNPLGTAMTMLPFGKQAGAASALLGFLQMGISTIAVSIVALLDWPVYLSLAGTLVVCMGASLVALLLSRSPAS